MPSSRFRVVLAVFLASAVWSAPRAANQAATTPAAEPTRDAATANRATLDRYCVGCHNERSKIAGLTLDKANLSNVRDDAALWEKVVRKLRTGTMPPQGARHPQADAAHLLLASLERDLDQAAASQPD